MPLSLTLVSQQDGAALGAHHAPANGPRVGGLVLLQEIFGVTPAMEQAASRFAAAGFEVVVPSLFDRIVPGFQVPVDPEGVGRGLAAVQATPRELVLGDLAAAVARLRGSGPVFVTGYCYGGAMAWLAAGRCDGIAAAACFYGRLISTMLDLTPRVPTILHYGSRDASIPLTAIADVRAAHPAVPCHVYDAGHGFCRTGHADYDAAACDLAFERTVAHFRGAAGHPPRA